MSPEWVNDVAGGRQRKVAMQNRFLSLQTGDQLDGADVTTGKIKFIDKNVSECGEECCKSNKSTAPTPKPKMPRMQRSSTSFATFIEKMSQHLRPLSQNEE